MTSFLLFFFIFLRQWKREGKVLDDKVKGITKGKSQGRETNCENKVKASGNVMKNKARFCIKRQANNPDAWF